MDDNEFYDRQGEILQDLGHALIEATPESWNEATLELEQEEEGCSHVITSREHSKDIVIATDDIFEATGRLEDLFRERGQLWKRAVFSATRNDNDTEESWAFNVEYTY